MKVELGTITSQDLELFEKEHPSKESVKKEVLDSEATTKEKALLHQYSFWFAALMPVFGALIFGVIIGTHNKLYFRIDLDGLNMFLSYMKIPLGIASLSFPLTAIMIAQHRSKLTILQIDEMQSTNRISNYYKHREEFYKLCTECEEIWPVKFKVVDVDLLYKTIFPDVNPNNFNLSRISGSHQVDFFNSTSDNINHVFEGIKSKWEEIITSEYSDSSKEVIEAMNFTCFMLDSVYCQLQMRVSNKELMRLPLKTDELPPFWVFIPEGNRYDALSTIANFFIKLRYFSMVNSGSIGHVDLPGRSWSIIEQLRSKSYTQFKATNDKKGS